MTKDEKIIVEKQFTIAQSAKAIGAARNRQQIGHGNPNLQMWDGLAHAAAEILDHDPGKIAAWFAFFLKSIPLQRTSVIDDLILTAADREASLDD